MTTGHPVQVAAISLSAVANIVLNSLVMIVIARTPTLREDRATLFMFSLAASDLAFGVCIMTTSAIFCSQPDIRINKFASAFAAISTWLTLASMYNLCSVCMCKMVTVTYPLRSTTLVTERRCYFVIVVSWTASFIVTAPIYMLDISWSHDLCFVRLTQAHDRYAVYVIIMHVFGGLIPMAVMVFANLTIFVVTVRVIKRVSVDGTHVGEVNNTYVSNQHTLATSIHKSV